MSLDKAIQHHKEYRKPYRRSEVWDDRCRCHGGCSYCLSNRLHSTRRNRFRAQEEIDDFFMDNLDLIGALDWNLDEIFEDPNYSEDADNYVDRYYEL